MPAKRRVARKRKRNMFTPAQYRCLQHGFIFFDEGRHYDGRSLWGSATLRTEMAGAWQLLRPQLLREWIALEPRSRDRGGAGTRPAGWWMFDSKERRRRTNGAHPFDNPARQARIVELEAGGTPSGRFNRLMYGCPSDFIVPDDFQAVYETQPEYIERLGLWLSGERDLYEAAAHRDDQRPNHPPTSLGGEP